MQSFRTWLECRSEEAPAADRLATIIAQSPAGVSLVRLRRLCGLPPETLQDILRGLVTSGQVIVAKVGEEIVYRVAG